MTAKEIIARIKAEVNRLKKQLVRGACAAQIQMETSCKDEAYDEMLSILSDLEKECEEKPTNIDFEQELYKHFGQVKDFTLGMQIGKYFYELGKQSKQPVCEGLEEEMDKFFETMPVLEHENIFEDTFKNIAHHFAQWGAEHAREQRKPKPSEELEEEIDKVYLHNRVVGYVLGDGEILLGREAFAYIARHFVRWGDEHRGSSEIPNIQDVNLAADNWICSHKDGEILYIKPAFIAGAKWQKEQMMKEAVEGEIVKDHLVTQDPRYFYASINVNLPEGVSEGDKVRIIIVKED